MKRIKSIVLLLTILLSVLSMCIIVGCKEKKVKTAKAKPIETPVKKLYVPFADETAEESTGITGESDDYQLEEPLESSDEEAEDDPNIYPEEESNEYSEEEPNDESDDEEYDYGLELPGQQQDEDSNDSPEEDPNESWL